MVKKRNNYKGLHTEKYNDPDAFHDRERYDVDRRPTKKTSYRNNNNKIVNKNSDTAGVKAKSGSRPASKRIEPVLKDSPQTLKPLPQYPDWIYGQKFNKLASDGGFQFHNYNLPPRADFYNLMAQSYPAYVDKFRYESSMLEGFLELPKNCLHENFQKGKPTSIFVNTNCWIHGCKVNDVWKNKEFKYNPLPGSSNTNIIKCQEIGAMSDKAIYHWMVHTSYLSRNFTNPSFEAQVSKPRIMWSDFIFKCKSVADDTYGNHVWGTWENKTYNFSRTFVGRYYAGRVYPCSDCMKGRCTKRAFEFRFVDWRGSNEIISDDVIYNNNVKAFFEVYDTLKNDYGDQIYSDAIYYREPVISRSQSKIPRGGSDGAPTKQQNRKPKKKTGKSNPKKNKTNNNKTDIFWGTNVVFKLSGQVINAIDPGALQNSCGFRALALMDSNKPMIWGNKFTEPFLNSFIKPALPLFMSFEESQLFLTGKLNFEDFSTSALELALVQIIKFGKIKYNIYTEELSYGHAGGTAKSLFLHGGHWYIVDQHPVNCPKPNLLMLPSWVQLGKDENQLEIIYSKYGCLGSYLTNKGQQISRLSEPFCELYSSGCFGPKFKFCKVDFKKEFEIPLMDEDYVVRYPFQTRRGEFKEVVFEPKKKEVANKKSQKKTAEKITAIEIKNTFDLLKKNAAAPEFKRSKQNLEAAVPPSVPNSPVLPKAQPSVDKIPVPPPLPVKPIVNNAAWNLFLKQMPVPVLPLKKQADANPNNAQIGGPIAPPPIPQQPPARAEPVVPLPDNNLPNAQPDNPVPVPPPPQDPGDQPQVQNDQPQAPVQQPIDAPIADQAPQAQQVEVPAVNEVPQNQNLPQAPAQQPAAADQNHEANLRQFEQIFLLGPDSPVKRGIRLFDKPGYTKMKKFEPEHRGPRKPGVQVMWPKVGELVVRRVSDSKPVMCPAELVPDVPAVNRAVAPVRTPLNDGWVYFGRYRPIIYEKLNIEPPPSVKFLSKLGIVKYESLEAYVPQIRAASINLWAGKTIPVKRDGFATLSNCFNTTISELVSPHLNSMRIELLSMLKERGYIERCASNPTTLPSHKSRMRQINSEIRNIDEYDDINRNFRKLSPYVDDQYTHITEEAYLYTEHTDATYEHMLDDIWSCVRYVVTGKDHHWTAPKHSMARSLMAFSIRSINQQFFYYKVSYSYPLEVLTARITSMGDLRKMDIQQFTTVFQTSVKSILCDLPNSSKGIDMLDEFFLAARVHFEIHRDKQQLRITHGAGDMHSLMSKNVRRG